MPTLATPPVAERKPHVTYVHGAERIDEYFWLRDKNDPAVTAYLEAENVYARSVLEPLEPLRDALYDEMLSHVKQTDLGVPYRLGDYWYYSRTEEGKQYPILARKRGTTDAPEEITLDLNVLAQGHAFFAIGAYRISPDGTLLAYSVDTTGYRQYALRVRDLTTGNDLPDTEPRVGDIVWAADNLTLVYTTEDEVSKRRDRVWRRALGATEATLVYAEDDERFDVGAAISNDRAYIFVASYSKATTHWQILASARPQDPLRAIAPRTDGHRYSVEHHGERFYILTNRDAENFRLVWARDDETDGTHWTSVVPERKDVFLDAFDAFAGHLVLQVRSGGFAGLEIFDLAGGTLEAVPCPEIVHTIGAQPNPEFAATTYRYTYTSLVTPPSVYEIDLATRQRTLLKATEVPGYDPSRYSSELEYATASDGTHVPLSIVRRAGLPLDGTGALLLYGYGSYGISIDPTFSAARLALLDRGVTFAIAHIRGGGELGEAWRTAGHLQRKRTTFGDFIAAAEHAIARGYTSPARLAIQGGSAGGLLVSAVANMRPDLFRLVISQVPFVDVVNTMLDASLPLTTSEYLEWGDPNVETDYAYMLGYSPYDNVRAQAYPAMLLKVSINDSQVPYWEGAKLAAKLRLLRTNDEPLLLVTNFGAGHGGASGRYDYLKEVAADYAFLLDRLGETGSA